jgi:virginiamycin B lyase
LLVCLVLATGCTAQGPLAPAPSRSPAPPAASLATGGIIEYAVPAPSILPADCYAPCSPSIGDLTLGPDGNVWFVDVSRSQVGRITPDGKVTQFLATSPTGGARTIAAGPDGNVWFTARGSGQDTTDWIVRVTPNGVVTKFPAGSGQHTAPESIAAGPDGNLWFTEVFGNRIGRMTPSGNLTEFEAPGNPRGIAGGPDGALWFTTSSAVGRITVNGHVTMYAVGNDPSLPLNDIALGSDGNLWFTQGSAIRHISPDGGRIVSVPVPQGSAPGSVASGPDGNIWFTDSGLNAVVRMSVVGTVRQFPMPRRGAFPHGMTVGADGRIWFVEADYGRIASIGVKVPEPSFSQGVALSERVLLFADASAKTITVTNTGDATLIVGTVKVTGVDNGAFATANDTCSSRSLAPGAACKVAVTHTSSGAPGVVQSAFLEFPDNGTGSPQRLSLVAQLRSCKLPIVESPSNLPPQGSMLDTTTGRALYEPGGSFTITSSPTRVNTVIAPVLTGWQSGYFDRAVDRWLPVPDARWVSPDGSRYVFIDYNEPQSNRDLHVVDVATGRERVLPMGPGFWNVIAFTSQGIYLHQAYEGVGPGLWLVNPDTGSIREVLTDEVVHQVSGTTAWTAVRNPADTLPQWGMGGGSNQIESRDLISGATQVWLYVPGSYLYVYGVYNGMPVVSVGQQTGPQVVVVTSPNNAKTLELPFTNGTALNLSGFISDPQGLWIGSPDGVYLWTARTGGVLVSTEPATPAGTCA